MLDRLIDNFCSPPSLRTINLCCNYSPLAILGQLVVTMSEWEVEVFNSVLKLFQFDIIMNSAKGQLWSFGIDVGQSKKCSEIARISSSILTLLLTALYARLPIGARQFEDSGLYTLAEIWHRRVQNRVKVSAWKSWLQVETFFAAWTWTRQYPFRPFDQYGQWSFVDQAGFEAFPAGLLNNLLKLWKPSKNLPISTSVGTTGKAFTKCDSSVASYFFGKSLICFKFGFCSISPESTNRTLTLSSRQAR